MFSLNDDQSIYITRGDVLGFNVGACTGEGEDYIFKAGDVVRFKVTEKRACDVVVLQKDFAVEAECECVPIFLSESDTKIGETISKPKDYWYEVELNPLTEPQTIIGYDEGGAKIFRLFPEGADVPPYEPTVEDIPVVDEELSAASERPVQNAAVAKAILEIEKLIAALKENTDADFEAIRLELNKLTKTVLSSGDSTYKIEEAVSAAMSKYKTEADNAYAAKGHNHDGTYAALVHSHTASDVGAAAVKEYEAEVSAADWLYDSAVWGGYIAEVSVSGILGTDSPIVDVAPGNTASENGAILEAWAQIVKIETQADSILLYAGETAPAADITVRLKVVR